MEVAVAVASWHSEGICSGPERRACGVKAGGAAAVLWLPQRRAWLLGRTWTGPWAEQEGGVEAAAEAAGPLSVCSGRAGASDV